MLMKSSGKGLFTPAGDYMLRNHVVLCWIDRADKGGVVGAVRHVVDWLRTLWLTLAIHVQVVIYHSHCQYCSKCFDYPPFCARNRSFRFWA